MLNLLFVCPHIALDQLTKTDHYNTSSSVNSSTGSAYSHQSYANNAGVNTGVNKSSVGGTGGYQTSAPQGYSNNSNNSYSNVQVSNTGGGNNSNYPTSANSNAYGAYTNQSSSNVYQAQSNASVSGSVNAGGVSTGSGSVPSIPSNNSR